MRGKEAQSAKAKYAVAILLVVVQIALLVALVVVTGRPLWNPPESVAHVLAVAQTAALVLAVAALAHLGEALTPLPIPTKGGALRKRGFYAIVRHPTYSAILLFAILRTLEQPTPWRMAVLAAILAFFSLKARWEERMLIAKFPAYQPYAARTGRFVPGVGLIRVKAAAPEIRTSND